MTHFPAIPVWDGCDPGIAAAIRGLEEEWRPYSTLSRKKRMDRLIEQVIDPAIEAFAATLPPKLLHFLPGAGAGLSFSDICRLVGFNGAARLQHQLLRRFIKVHNTETAQARRFVATMETLLELTRGCARKPPLTAHVEGKRVNKKRIQEFCRYCGSPTEMAAYAAGRVAGDAHKSLRYSSQYCSTHRPALTDDKLNPEYQKARRSAAQFDNELERLSRQAGNWRAPAAGSGDWLVDCYLHHYVLKHRLRYGDTSELRDHARRMTDARLTDRKKQIVMLLRYGMSQSDAASVLGVQRQAVSKASASIPSVFWQLPSLPEYSTEFLLSGVARKPAAPR
ncbi:hypothetical protein [Methylocaldum szegediense]|uniref:LuxR family transcriptional regulator n=1 Tax=Methylocaldum szegediense TaxID=73780 RepID=A0ABN8X3S5_9GAMM|nr:hypothetical protein [Methylocaldum szegediense]CAI8858540.1 LuxR family transcriptional regulator [Methylocaldum szegediense]